MGVKVTDHICSLRVKVQIKALIIFGLAFDQDQINSKSKFLRSDIDRFHESCIWGACDKICKKKTKILVTLRIELSINRLGFSQTIKIFEYCVLVQYLSSVPQNSSSEIQNLMMLKIYFRYVFFIWSSMTADKFKFAYKLIG